MNYPKITLEAIVLEDDPEVFVQALNDKLDVLEDMVTIQSSAIYEDETTEGTGISGKGIAELTRLSSKRTAGGEDS